MLTNFIIRCSGVHTTVHASGHWRGRRPGINEPVSGQIVGRCHLHKDVTVPVYETVDSIPSIAPPLFKVEHFHIMRSVIVPEKVKETC